MVEMSETADILRSATPRSLVLLDEVGPRHLDLRRAGARVGGDRAPARRRRARARAPSSPPTITSSPSSPRRLPRLVNVHVAVKEWGDQVVFLHRIAEGAADRSYGIHVAQLAGLPEPVLERAREVLAELESERTVEHLEHPARRRGAPREAGRTELAAVRAAPHPLEASCDALEPEPLTPLEALNLLAEWKKKWGS